MRALVFAPHAGIWVHSFPEALIADALRAAGMDLVYVTCGGALSSFCITMGSRGLSTTSPEAAKQEVCRACRRDRDYLRTGFGFAGNDFERVLTAADHELVERWIASASPQRIADFEIEGVKVGRATLYEYLIHNKKSVLELSDDEWPAFRPRLVNALRSLLAANAILDRERPARVLAYNTLYSVNAMWRAAATRRGIPIYFLHAGVNLSDRLRRMIIGRDSTIAWYLRLIEAWPRHRDVPCHDAELAAVTDHFRQLFRGTSMFAYSTAQARVDIRARFGVGADQKLVVASMSSYDEYIAAAAVGEMPATPNQLFPTQIDWIRALGAWFRDRRDLFLIVRVHPREFPNKRDSVKSDHAAALERELAVLPPNVRVNWPADKLSIYDLAEHADVFLNAWSSAGREMALLGLPVVVYCPELLLYPADLNDVGTTRDSYFGAIDRALRDGWSFERMRRAYRWCALELVRGVVDIGDGFQFSEDPPRGTLERGARYALSLPGVRQRWDLLRRPRRLREEERIASMIRESRATLVDDPAAPAGGEPAETAALQREIGRLIDALYGDARGPAAPGTLRDRLEFARLPSEWRSTSR